MRGLALLFRFLLNAHGVSALTRWVPMRLRALLCGVQWKTHGAVRGHSSQWGPQSGLQETAGSGLGPWVLRPAAGAILYWALKGIVKVARRLPSCSTRVSQLLEPPCKRTVRHGGVGGAELASLPPILERKRLRAMTQSGRCALELVRESVRGAKDACPSR